MAENSEDNYKTLMGYKQRLQLVKKDAEDTKTARITGEATIKQLTKNEDEVIDKITKLGYDPNNLKNIISNMVNELGTMLDKIESISPDENGIMPANYKELLTTATTKTQIISELESADFNDIEF